MAPDLGMNRRARVPETSLRRCLAVLALAAAGFAADSAAATEGVSTRKILDVGCHNTDGVCFVTLDGASFGSSLGCAVSVTNEFRFDNGDTSIGRRSYASILAAFLSGRSVSIVLNGCTNQGFPALHYFHVLN